MSLGISLLDYLSKLLRSKTRVRGREDPALARLL